MKITIQKLKKYRKRLIREAVKRIILFFYGKKFIRNIVHLFHKAKYPQKWVFIVGCYNSGTTLLQRLMSAHLEITTLPKEGVQLTSYLPRPEWYGWNRMWYECLEKIAFPRKKDPQKIKKIIMDWSPFFNSKCPVFMEKSIANMTRIEWLEENLNNVYFIGIVRNPYAVASGIRKRAFPEGKAKEKYGDTYPIELTATQWKAANQIILEAPTRVKNFCYIHYENLVSEPIPTLEKLFTFLNLSIPNISLNNNLLKINTYTEKIDNKNSENINLVNSEEEQKIFKIAHELMIKLGYKDTANE